jgi:hypothetical protein
MRQFEKTRPEKSSGERKWKKIEKKINKWKQFEKFENFEHKNLETISD